MPRIWFVVEMYFLFSFGREVERFIGRDTLRRSLSLPGRARSLSPDGGGPMDASGARRIRHCQLRALCRVLHHLPERRDLLYLQGKMDRRGHSRYLLAAILAAQAWVYLLIFWATCLGAFLFIKYLRGHFSFSLGRWATSSGGGGPGAVCGLCRVRAPVPRRKPPAPRGDDVIESIDPLLDKIAKEGLGA